jgi:hypothetical protein
MHYECTRVEGNGPGPSRFAGETEHFPEVGELLTVMRNGAYMTLGPITSRGEPVAESRSTCIEFRAEGSAWLFRYWGEDAPTATTATAAAQEIYSARGMNARATARPPWIAMPEAWRDRDSFVGSIISRLTDGWDVSIEAGGQAYLVMRRDYAGLNHQATVTLIHELIDVYPWMNVWGGATDTVGVDQGRNFYNAATSNMSIAYADERPTLTRLEEVMHGSFGAEQERVDRDIVNGLTAPELGSIEALPSSAELARRMEQIYLERERARERQRAMEISDNDLAF